MCRPNRIYLVAVACISLTGCFTSTTLYNTEVSALSSPYRLTDVREMENGILSVKLDDPAIKDADIRRTKLIEAVLITDEGRQIPLKPWVVAPGDGITFMFKLGDVGFDGDHFGLRIVTSLDGKEATVTGTFTIHSHAKVSNLLDALDPGGK
jgi:hypothetical protein